MSSRKSAGAQHTIFDVAELAGVSIKTVSRVANNEPNVHQKTRDKVSKAIETLQYRPNSAARGLSGKRSYVIGLVYENPHEFSYMKDVLNGALKACETQGFTLLLLPLSLPSDTVVEDIRRFAIQTRLEGMVLPAPIGDFTEVVSLLGELQLPYAQIGPKKPQPDAITIFCDDEDASCRLTEYVISQGHQRIGFIKGHPDHGATQHRYRGYRRALKNHGMTYDRTLVKQGYFDFESGKAAGLKLMELDKPPSVIIASNDDMAAGVIFEAHEKGLVVPTDLSVVGFDDTPLASHIWPPLTTVRQPITEMADSATSLLISRLRGETVASPTEEFCCELIIRSSTGS